MKAIKKCGVCGSERVDDLGHGKFEATVICNDCKAHWWKRWYTLAEWEKYINEKSPSGLEGVNP